MKKIEPDAHRFTYEAPAGHFHAEQDKYDVVFAAIKYGFEIAKRFNVDVVHEIYNPARYRWDVLGTYHPDGTGHHWTGYVQRFTGDPNHPWAPTKNRHKKQTPKNEQK